MNLKNKISFITLLSASAFTLQAADKKSDNYYIGAGVNFLSYEQPGVKANFTAVSGRLGTYINDYLSAEARLGFGLQGDDFDVFGTTVDLDLNYVYGIYARAGLPLNEKLYPYVLLGYSKGEVETSAGSTTTDKAASGTSFGFGIDFKLNNKLTLNAEYINLLDRDAVKVAGFNLGASVSF
jgi:opacity protein-like surface antigen